MPALPALSIAADIAVAETLPGQFYQNPGYLKLSKERLFARSWQWIGTTDQVLMQGAVVPFEFLPHFLREPLLLCKDRQSEIRVLSNVCTHRGSILCHHPGKLRNLVCPYHGRRFSLDGRLEFMPEFEGVQDFPRPVDDLTSFPLTHWKQFLFTSLNPAFSLENLWIELNQRVGFLPLEALKYRPEFSKNYLVHAHWALYCDNYLEGFHIPFVHPDLNQSLDYNSYETQLGDYYSLQIGYAKEEKGTFELPIGHPDAGRFVAAYYYWIFPNMMLNFYPWGLSVNLVQPQTTERTRVVFLTYVLDEKKFRMGAEAQIDKVEREDEFIVESVQRGLHSRAYTTGRYSAKREQGVHHFHRLLARFLHP